MIGTASLSHFAFYRIILAHLREQIDKFGMQLFGNVTVWVASVALVLVTLWILIHGYRIATGTSRESMAAFVVSAAKMAFICSLATTMSFMGTSIHELVAVSLPNEISLLVTSDDKTAEEQIDENMAWMSVALTAIDSVNTGGDPALDSRKTQAMLLAGAGTGGPAIVAGSMLLLYQIALVLFVGLGPLFILSLMFEQTKSFFSKWLFYGIGTMFSMAVLAVMTGIAMKMIAKVAAAMWTTSIIGAIGGQDFTQGINAMAMQQGGMGIILTTLIMTAPPMAAYFFQGTLAGFVPFAQIGAGSTTTQQAPGPHGQPAGSHGTERGYNPSPTYSDGSSRDRGAARTHSDSAISQSINDLLSSNRGAAGYSGKPVNSDGRRGKASPGSDNF